MSSEPPVSSWNEQIQKTTESVANLIRWIAELIRRRNWFMLLVLLGVVLAFVINILKGSLSKFLPGLWLWLPVALPFAAALVVAVVTMPREQKQATVEVERQAIKGLRPFGFDDAEIYLRLQRGQGLGDCLGVLNDSSFRFGVLMGESGCGKTSFLQAGVWPRLTQPEGRLRAVYVRFSDEDPLLTIRRAMASQLELPEEWLTTLAQPPTENDTNQGFIALLHQAVKTAGKPVVLLLDQFEQFFVHYRQPSERQPFVETLATWYRHPHPPAVKVLVSIRSDMLYFLDDLHKAMAYALGPQEVIQLKKFTPTEATNILAVIAETEHLRFDRQFVTEVVEQELASRDQGEVSPVDLQILAWMIERQSEEGLRAFNREAFQRFGGVEGLLSRFLEEALAARMTTPQRQAAVKVLLAMTDMERQTRAGVLSTADLTTKLKGSLTAEAVEEAVNWLARGDVRLITPEERETGTGYELAHERLIPALMRLAGKELSEVDKTNQLLDRRVNEWMGNQRSRRYLLSWRELWSIQRQRPYLVWGAKRRQKERLLLQSQRWVYGRLALVPVLLLVVGGVSSWLLWTPDGQIRQVRWHLERLQTENESEAVEAALAFAKDGKSDKAWKLFKEKIKDSYFQGEYLNQYIEVVLKLNPSSPDQGELNKALKAAEAMPADSSSKPGVLGSIATAAATLTDQKAAQSFLQDAFKATMAIRDDSSSQADALSEIAAAAATLTDQKAAQSLLKDAFNAALNGSLPNDSYNQADTLSRIAAAATTLKDQDTAKGFLQDALTAAKALPPPSADALSEIAAAAATLRDKEVVQLLLQDALAAAEAIPDPDPSSQADALSEIAAAAATLPNQEAAQSLLKDAFNAALNTSISNDNDNDSYYQADALSRIVEVAATLTDQDAAKDLLQDALTAAKEIPDSDSFSKADALIRIAESTTTLENPEIAKTSLQDALTVAKETPQADTLSRIAAAAATLTDQDAAKNLLQDALTAAKATSFSYAEGPPTNGEPLSSIATLAATLRDKENAQTVLRDALKAAKETPDGEFYADFKADALSSIAETAAKVSQETAEGLLQDAFTAAKGISYSTAKVAALSRIATAAATLPSKKDAAKDFLQDARKAAEAIPDSHSLSKADALISIAESATTLENSEIARTSLQDALTVAKKIPNLDLAHYTSHKANALNRIATAAVTLPNKDAAKDLLQDALRVTKDLPDIEVSAENEPLIRIAESAATLENQEVAKNLFQQALEIAENTSTSRSRRLKDISELYANQDLWKQALAALNKCIGSQRNQALTTILTRWAEKKQPTLIDGAVVLKVTPRGTPKAYTFEVEIQSPGNDCESYTDWWEVLRADTQTLVYRQFLSPKDQAKSPFTRTSDKPIDIQPEDEVIVRAHLYQNYGDQSEGYGAQQAWRGSVAKGFELIRSSPNFAARLADEDPQPPACAD